MYGNLHYDLFTYKFQEILFMSNIVWGCTWSPPPPPSPDNHMNEE